MYMYMHVCMYIYVNSTLPKLSYFCPRINDKKIYSFDVYVKKIKYIINTRKIQTEYLITYKDIILFCLYTTTSVF